MQRLTTIEISKEYLHFSAAHFTIFSATERERLHGHNFRVAVRVVVPVDDNGLCFDYQIIKDKLLALCEELDEYTLLPGESPYLTLHEADQYCLVEFNNEVMHLLTPDVKVLPVRNITLEDLSYYLLQQLVEGDAVFGGQDIRELEIKVSSGPSQWGSSCWTKENTTL